MEYNRFDSWTERFCWDLKAVEKQERKERERE